jgi:hypothetical protein
MDNLEYVVLGVGVVHLVLATFFIRDLFTFSKRPNKKRWLFFLLLVPFLSAYAYRISMKRKRRQYFFLQ